MQCNADVHDAMQCNAQFKSRFKARFKVRFKLSLDPRFKLLFQSQIQRQLQSQFKGQIKAQFILNSSSACFVDSLSTPTPPGGAGRGPKKRDKNPQNHSPPSFLPHTTIKKIQ